MLSGKRILVTGANGGIGFSISELFLKNNAKLVLFYHKNKNSIEKLNQYKNSMDLYQVDLLNDTDIETSIKAALGNGPIDGFIHSVSHSLDMKSFSDLDWKNFQSQIDLQTRSFFKIAKSVIPSMKSHKYGKIISILTNAVTEKPPSNMSDYLVGKYSLLGLTKSLAVELERFNIMVNGISPSMVDTNLIANLPNKFKEIAASQSPTGKLTTPDDIASVALFLCSNQADHVSGENVVVSGGTHKSLKINTK